MQFKLRSVLTFNPTTAKPSVNFQSKGPDDACRREKPSGEFPLNSSWLGRLPAENIFVHKQHWRRITSQPSDRFHLMNCLAAVAFDEPFLFRGAVHERNHQTSDRVHCG